MDATTSSISQAMELVLQDALKNIKKIHEKEQQDLSRKNAELDAANQALRSRVQELEQRIQQTIEDDEADKSRELMSRLLAANSQIIHAKDDFLDVQAENHQMQLQIKEYAAALDKMERNEAENRIAIEASVTELGTTKKRISDLEQRLEEETKIYEKNLKEKERIIADLDSKVSSEHASVIPNKENMEIDALVDAHPPLHETSNIDAASASDSSSLEAKYRRTCKKYEVLMTQYDNLHKTYLNDTAIFQDSRARWTQYKNQVRKGLQRIKDTPSSKDKLRATAPPEGETSTPTIDKTSLRLSLMKEWKVRLDEIDIEDQQDEARLFARLAALPTSTPTPLPGAGDVAEEPPNNHSRTSVDCSHPEMPKSPDRQRAYSPTMSEEPLSQLPHARLQELQSSQPHERSPSPPRLAEAPTAGPSRAPRQPLHVKAEPIDPPDNMFSRRSADIMPPPPVPLPRGVKKEVEASPTATQRPTHKRRHSSPSKLVASFKIEVAQDASPAAVLGKRKSTAEDTRSAKIAAPDFDAHAVGAGEEQREPPASKDVSGVDYARYKGRGRYAKTSTTSDKAIRAEFEIDRSRNEGFDYQYDAVVRNKEQRRRMDATDCECCTDYYQSVSGLAPISKAPQWRSPDRNQVAHSRECPHNVANPQEDVTSMINDHQRLISRHRHDWLPASTPPDYWNTGFPSTQQLESINRRADEREKAKRAQIEREAEKPDGRYKRRK